MIDEELLELAAKAAGIEYTGESYARTAVGGGHFDNYYWNPLADDGDALRLAVNLGIDVMSSMRHINMNYCKVGTSTYGELDKNHMKATRRAIVRAAAEIGRTMK